MPPNRKRAVVLGIDPGLATTGWGVLRQEGPSAEAVAYGVVETPAGTDLPLRLQQLHRELTKLIAHYRPDVLAIEELFFAKFARSIASTAQARGVILLTAAEQQLPVVEYNPRAVKMAITGFGSAQKLQIQEMVQRHFRLKVLPEPDDAADALAIALCHVHTLSELATSRAMVPSLERAIAQALEQSK